MPSAAHPFNYGALRYFNVAGADPQRRAGQQGKGATHLIKVACETAVGLRDRFPSSAPTIDTPDGTCVRDYIHVSDLAAAHVAALEWLIAHPEENLIVNCGYGRGLSVLEVLDALDRLTNQPIKRVMEGRRAGDPPMLISANQRILDTLDWTPGITTSTASSAMRSSGSGPFTSAGRRAEPGNATPGAPGPKRAFRDDRRAPSRSSHIPSAARRSCRNRFRRAGHSPPLEAAPLPVEAGLRRFAVRRRQPDHAASSRAMRVPSSRSKIAGPRRDSSSRQYSASSARSSIAPSAAGQPEPVLLDWK